MNTNIVIKGSAPWLPLEVRGRGWKHGFRFSRAERNVYLKRRKIPVSRWAERHRVITMGAVQGRWRNETTPYLAGIMDAAFFTSVETVTICAADQVGKSECVNNLIGYAIDRAPGPVLYVYPDEQTAKENSRDRILPMITSSPRLRHYLTGQDDDEAALRINLTHMPIYMAWARSASRLANKPIKYVVFDETDKYPDTAGKREASPIRKGEKRLRTYRHSRKTFKLSTPTVESGPIWQSLTQEAETIFDFHVQCPECGLLQRMVFPQIRWPEDVRDPARVENEDLARYECEGCEARWDDYQRNLAVQRGEWKSRRSEGEKVRGSEGEKVRRTEGEKVRGSEGEKVRGSEGEEGLEEYLVQRQPRRIGFHIPSWLSRFVGLSEVAAAFLRGLKDKIELRDFLNSHAAEPWTDITTPREEDEVLRLRDTRPFGLVPEGEVISCLTAGVDTQDNGFWYEVRAWGPWYLDEELHQLPESWQLRCGFVESFDRLWEALNAVYLDVVGTEYKVGKVVIDAMGHRTDQVYEFARRHWPTVSPFKGERSIDQLTKEKPIDTYPGTNRPYRWGINLLRGDVTRLKNMLSDKLRIAPADAGAWHLCAETPIEWAAHLCAEYPDEKGFWVNPMQRANHGWDCSVYNLAAIYHIRYIIRKPRKKGDDAPRQETGDRNVKQKTDEGWLKKKNSWFKR